MAFPENSSVDFFVRLIGGEKQTIRANSSDSLYEALESHGMVPKSNDHFVFYFKNAVINPYISIGGLNIKTNDTIVVLEQKNKNPLVTSQSFDNFRTISAADYPLSYSRQTHDDSDNVYDQPTRPYTVTIVPRQPLEVSRDPLPKFFVSSHKINNDFWTNLERRYAGN
ncbi:hypothetical protein TVAG_248730 [Trichomonas vaginalis G3]|uniref:Ubiquitin-like domain-containing protein n=1 Tax=Trichomonas vaginalis (strain ATCC PRA-98 / G3) TaxID=412133 RepID=A2E7A9_TRIV3|nr:ubiquitin-like family [Trichomonas vaginalis G3]EAY11506.1 hypothetical protein TVAG_248730 [Trichomonas vaginalis G3]KAI5526731.1 ubiquitin-like family [Trichomonas vaginalis G3]|eukprot:XP_001323729.1 hypothetical protein [Trichomonas vaginalis G3]